MSTKEEGARTTRGREAYDDVDDVGVHFVASSVANAAFIILPSVAHCADIHRSIRSVDAAAGIAQRVRSRTAGVVGVWDCDADEHAHPRC